MELFALGVVVGVVISWIVAVKFVVSPRHPCGVCGKPMGLFGGRFDGRDLCARHVPRSGYSPPPAKPERLPVIDPPTPPPSPRRGGR